MLDFLPLSASDAPLAQVLAFLSDYCCSFPLWNPLPPRSYMLLRFQAILRSALFSSTSGGCHRPAGGAFIGHLPLRSSPSCCCLLCISAWRPQSPPTKHIKPELMFPPNLLFLMSPLSWLKDSWFSTHDVFQTGNRGVTLQSFSPSPNQPVPRCRGFHFPSESPCCH